MQCSLNLLVSSMLLVSFFVQMKVFYFLSLLVQINYFGLMLPENVFEVLMLLYEERLVASLDEIVHLVEPVEFFSLLRWIFVVPERTAV